MTPSTAGQLRKMLEIAGGVTLGSAFAVSTVVQAKVWRSIHGGGADSEHEDFKIRIEARRLELKKEEVVEQERILRKLEQAHEQLQKEQDDVRAIHGHTAVITNPLALEDGEGSESTSST